MASAAKDRSRVVRDHADRWPKASTHFRRRRSAPSNRTAQYASVNSANVMSAAFGSLTRAIAARKLSLGLMVWAIQITVK